MEINVSIFIKLWSLDIGIANQIHRLPREPLGEVRGQGDASVILALIQNLENL